MMHQTYYLTKHLIARACLLLGLVLSMALSVQAQSDYFVDFESGDPFNNNGHVRSEFNPAATDDCDDARRLGDNLNAVCDMFPDVPAQDNGHCMSYNVNDSDVVERNIIWVVDNFVPGDYRVSFDLVKRYAGDSMTIEVRKGQYLSNITLEETFVMEEDTEWHTYSTCIHLTDVDQIFELVLVDITINDDFAIDNFILEKVKEPEFEFVDATGSPVDKYCYGEDVYITLVEDLPVSSFFFAVRNGCDAVNDYTIGGWNPYVGGAPINLSQILRDKGKPAIKPELPNCLKVAINDPYCGWQDLSKEFDYNCEGCETDYAAFVASPISSNGLIAGNALRDYTPYDGSHEFCVYTDVDSDGNFELVTCFQGPSFTFQGQLNVNYYILHTVITPCGEFCDLTQLCTGDDCPASTPTMGCESVIPPVCEAPVLSCSPGSSSSILLTWSSVTEASRYELEFITNDPDCGCTGASSVISWSTTDTSIFTSSGVCYSVKVRAVCDFGISDWSGKICSEDCLTGDEPDRNIQFETLELPAAAALSNIYPNPFTQELNLAYSGLSSEEVEVMIYDLKGTLIEQLRYPVYNGNLNEVWYPQRDLTAGMYLVRLIDGDQVITSKVLRQ